LDNGVLFVDGDLSVSGGVTGTGAILVTGDSFISGRSTLTTDNVAALISDGDLEIQGDAKGTSHFRGLVYTNSGLRAENVTLVGTLIVAGENSELTLKDTNVIYSPDSIRVDLQHTARTALNFVAPQGANPGAYLGTGQDDKSVHSKKRIYISVDDEGHYLVYPAGQDERNALKAVDVESAIAAIRTLLGAEQDEKALQAFRATTSPRLENLLTGLANNSIEPEEPTIDLLTFDPSQLIGLSDKIRLVLMRDI
jgi:hypothetical protein